MRFGGRILKNAPVVGFEPTTVSLTGSRSTVELHRNANLF